MSASHLSCLRNRERRERLEWLGDTVLEEAIARLMGREAMAALELQQAGVQGFGVPATLRPLAQRFGEALGFAVSNTNLSAVYAAELGGLVRSLGLGAEDDYHLGGRAGGRLCSSNTGPAASTGAGSQVAKSPMKKRQKCRPDLVESAIGEAFTASLSRGGGVYGDRTQRFAGGHRADLVDRLLSTALSTEILFSYLESGVSSAPRGDGALAGFSNRFDALGADHDEDEQEDEGCVDSSAPAAGGFTCIHGENNSTAGATTVVVGNGLDDNDETSDGAPLFPIVAALPLLSPDKRLPPPQASKAEETIRYEQDVCEEQENVDAAREGVLKVYGAALLRFRVSVFLFCSGDVGGANGVERREGPKDLTMRRQMVMCAENLEAVATHLQFPGAGDGRGDSGSGGGGAHHVVAADALPSAPNWLRVAVGHATLTGYNPEFSTRVAALLLLRSGEQRGPAPSTGVGSADRAAYSREPDITLIKRGRPKAAREETIIVDLHGQVNAFENRSDSSAVDAQVTAVAAVAQVQFSRDPWPEKDLPRASEQAAKLFSPPYNAPPKVGRAGFVRVDVDRGGGGCSRGCRSRGGAINAGDSNASTFDGRYQAHTGGRKRKRQEAEKADSRINDHACPLPPHYEHLLSSLPRDKRILLARLGHHGYVKVFENLLDRFLCSSRSSHRGTPPAQSTPISLASQQVCFAAAGGIPSTFAAKLLAGDVEGSSSSYNNNSNNNNKNSTRSNSCQEDIVRIKYTNSQPFNGDATAAEAHNIEPWHALRTGTFHPSLFGLVEPLDLVRVETDRLVLPIPNPFYRRVLHALCLVHGLCSRGGEMANKKGRVAGGGCDRETVERHRTVEVIRSVVVRKKKAKGGSEIEGSGGEAKAVGAAVGPLVPVERLLKTRR